ncbi:MAG TPA: energy transducer TonB [Terriglobia bacterium]|nr:energy transducer TonB [Terriglobia bacterium]
MQKSFVAAVAFAFLSIPPLFSSSAPAPGDSEFQPPRAASIDTATSHIGTIGGYIGTVVLDVMISEEGKASDIQVRRDIPPIAAGAVEWVKTWTFEAAKSNGKPARSRMTVAVTVNTFPFGSVTGQPSLPRVIPQDDEARIQSAFQPPVVTRAAYADYPALALAPGEVILETTLNESGKVESTKVLRDAPPFTTAAIQALAHWRFIAATLNGKPVPANMIIVYAFPPKPYVLPPGQ